MRLRQIALVAADLEPTVKTLTDVLGIEVCIGREQYQAFHKIRQPRGLDFQAPDFRGRRVDDPRIRAKPALTVGHENLRANLLVGVILKEQRTV